MMVKKVQEMMKKKQMRIAGLLGLSCVLLGATIIGIWLLRGEEEIVEQQVESVALLTKEAYGILVLGSDKGATKTNGGDHTDSITYVAINKQTNKAYALPIYRDSLLHNQCTNEDININHVYRDSGSSCLVQSVTTMLRLPVDYHIYITSNGFVDVMNAIGPLEISAEASYCSAFGNDEHEYCFAEGESKALSGNALLAYSRYRGTTSGEKRAMRHVQVLNKAFAECIASPLICGGAIAQGVLRQDIQTDLPYEEALSLGFVSDLTLLSTITGTNFEDTTGWHHKIDEDDLHEKVEKIRTEIFG